MSTDGSCKFDTFYVFEQWGDRTFVWACCRSSDVEDSCDFMSDRVQCGNQFKKTPTVEWTLLNDLNDAHHEWARSHQDD